MKVLIFFALTGMAFPQSLTVFAETSVGDTHHHFGASYDTGCQQKDRLGFCGSVWDVSFLRSDELRQGVVSGRFKLQLAKWLEIQPGLVSVAGHGIGNTGGGASLGWRAAQNRAKYRHPLFSEGLWHWYVAPERDAIRGLRAAQYSLGEAETGVQISKHVRAGLTVDRVHNTPKTKETLYGPFTALSKGPATFQLSYYPHLPETAEVSGERKKYGLHFSVRWRLGEKEQ